MIEDYLNSNIQEIESYGDSGLSDKYLAIVQNLYADPKVQALSEGQQETLFSKIHDRYAQEAGTLGLEKTSAIGNILDDSEGPTLGETKSYTNSEYGGTSEGSARALGSLEGSAKDTIGSSLASAGVASVVGGIPIGDAIKSILNPSTLITGGVSAIGNAMTSGMGFGYDADMVDEGLGVVLSAALSMVNPVLGVAASVLGKPIIDAARDLTDTRNLEGAKDSLEDVMGQIKARGLMADHADLINSSNMAAWDDSGEKFDKIQDYYSAIASDPTLSDARRLEVAEMSSKLTELADAQRAGDLNPVSTYDNMVASAKSSTQEAYNNQRAKTLGITRDEYDSKVAEAEALGVPGQITGTAITDARKSSGGNYSTGYNSSGDTSWGGSTGYSNTRSDGSSSMGGNSSGDSGRSSGSSNSSGGSQNNSAGDQSSSDGVGGR